MSDGNDRCVNCGRSSVQVPLLGMRYTGRDLYICPQCLPILIHQPGRIAAVQGEWTSNPVEHEVEHEGG